MDWPGRLSAVLFLPGCNFRCPYCHNSDLVLKGNALPDWPLIPIIERLRNLKGWVEGVCITGGEPTLHAELPDIFAALKSAGFRTKLDTNGTNPGMLARLIKEELMDYVAMDVKAPLNPHLYSRCTGAFAPIRKIEKSIAILMGSKIPYHFRTTVVPKLHSPEEILHLAAQLYGARSFKLQNFNPGNTLDPAFQNEIPFEPEVFKELQLMCSAVISGKPCDLPDSLLEIKSWAKYQRV